MPTEAGLPHETIDRMGLAAMPAFTSHDEGNVVFRAAGGFNCRNSSVTVFEPARESASDLVPRTLSFCEAQGIRPVLRLIGDPGGFGHDLRSAGWAPFRDCLVMARDGGGAGEMRLPPGLAPCKIAPWLDIQVAHKLLQGRDAGLFREIFGRVPEGALPLRINEPGPPATALIYRESGWIGLINMLVAPALRGQGVGQRFLELLFEIPATGFWLQVYAGNAPAIGLYRKSGFEVLYAYSYWSPD